MSDPTPKPKPTQVDRPWRATVRTIVQVAVPLILSIPILVAIVSDELEKAGVALPPSLAGLLTGAAATVTVGAAIVARIMAIPAVEALLRRYKVLSWLAAGPDGK